MTRIYITRHGETQWNTERRMQGRKDSDLTSSGKQQATWLSKRFENINISKIYSSSSGRALKTAEIIKGNKDIELIKCDELMEISLGDWEGMCVDDVLEKYPAEHDLFWNKPHLFKRKGAETFKDVQYRIVNFVYKLVDKHPNEDILIVTHAVVLKSLMTYFEGRELSSLWDDPFIKPTSLSLIEFDGDKHTVHMHGDISHYEIDNSTRKW